MIWRKKEKKKAQYQFNSERVFLVATQPAKTAYSYFQTSSVGPVSYTHLTLPTKA